MYASAVGYLDRCYAFDDDDRHHETNIYSLMHALVDRC